VFRIDPIIGKRISYGTCNCTNPKSIKYMLGTGYWHGIEDIDEWFW
jgi:hypothetical protein